MIGWWWRSNLYRAGELRTAFATAGFSAFELGRFPPAAWHLVPWGHVVEATR
jgi:hypothetical protein